MSAGSATEVNLTDDSNRLSAVHVFDGGISTEICRRCVDLHPISWSGLVSLTHPELITTIHVNYIEAGARIITTNTFAASKHILQAAGSADLFSKANRLSVELAVTARDESEIEEVLVAGSLSALPPLDKPDNAPKGAKVVQNYRDQADILAESGVDFLLIEMQYDSESALSLIEACLSTGLPVWVGVSASRLPDGKLVAYRPSGKYTNMPDESFASLVNTVVEASVTAIGVMHTPLALLQDALAVLRDKWVGQAFAYPETGCFAEPNWDFSESVEPEVFARQMCKHAEVFSLHAIGGCCGTTPAHIRSLTELLGRKVDIEN